MYRTTRLDHDDECGAATSPAIAKDPRLDPLATRMSVSRSFLMEVVTKSTSSTSIGLDLDGSVLLQPVQPLPRTRALDIREI